MSMNVYMKKPLHYILLSAIIGYERWLIEMKKLTYQEAKAFALAHYDEGGDGLYEAVEEKEYEPMTEKELLDLFHLWEENAEEISMRW